MIAQPTTSGPPDGGGRTPLLSVVIPAHNEEAGIGRCLRTLLAGPFGDCLDIVVVANGCTDDTADVAISFGPRVRVLRTPVASKVNALNAGDAFASTFPRCYLDADVQLSADGLRSMASALSSGQVDLAVPRLRVDLNDRPWTVRAFYRIWTALPYFSQGVASSGAYMLSERGRSAFGDFPDVLADDHFVVTLVPSDRRALVREAESVVQAPWRLRDLVSIKTRGFLGERQLARESDRLLRPHGGRGAWVRTVLRDPRLWTAVPVYLGVNGVAELRARRRLREADYRWETDASSRRASV